MSEIDPEKAKKLKPVVMPPIFNRDLSNTDLTNHPKIKNKSAFSWRPRDDLSARAKYILEHFGYTGDPLALS